MRRKIGTITIPEGKTYTQYGETASHYREYLLTPGTYEVMLAPRGYPGAYAHMPGKLIHAYGTITPIGTVEDVPMWIQTYGCGDPKNAHFAIGDDVPVRRFDGESVGPMWSIDHW